ncbi:hypothetical protein [uncultured Phascolarctobacterium sp.]|uniref:hypothetical protein n=1 Tax=uncultured Phascolarctobacterium sp. TaxID=512296 RepID=UPI0025EF37AE|nr:hypothetical protein [uncultured Phascolarctobacterium sp.]
MAKPQKFKERLTRYTFLLEEIRIEECRKNALSSGGGLLQRRALAGVCDELKLLLDKESEEYEALTRIINQVPHAAERQVLMARYMDGRTWPEIAAAVYGNRADYEERQQSYMRSIYRIHGNALLAANKIMARDN